MPGDGRPAYEHSSQARQILNDAEDDLREWQLELEDVPTSSYNDASLVGTNGGVNGKALANGTRSRGNSLNGSRRESPEHTSIEGDTAVDGQLRGHTSSGSTKEMEPVAE